MKENTEKNHRSSTHQRFVARYGPWALVTGASDGIGRSCAQRLASFGLNVVLVARRGSVLEALAEDLQSAHAIETLVVEADLASPSGVESVILATEKLDVGLLIAAAGFGTAGNFCDSDLHIELEMLAVNCSAVTALSHHFASQFVRKTRGGLVLFGSLVGFQGVARAAHYAATKAYIQSLAEGLRLELAPHNVDVLSSAPGPVLSGFGARSKMTMTSGVHPDTVARSTLGALGMWGTIRPGWLSRLLEFSLSMLPRWGRVRVISLVMAGMTRKQLAR